MWNNFHDRTRNKRSFKGYRNKSCFKLPQYGTFLNLKQSNGDKKKCVKKSI